MNQAVFAPRRQRPLPSFAVQPIVPVIYCAGGPIYLLRLLRLFADIPGYMRSLWLKRVFDLVAVIATVPLWLPFIGVIALVVRLKLGSPIFFRQSRPGLGGQVFELLKFRTMTDARDGSGALRRLPAPGISPPKRFLKGLGPSATACPSVLSV